MLNFTINNLTDIAILSVFNDTILIGTFLGSKLMIISSDGRNLGTISLQSTDSLYDAVWTPRGNIVYTTSRRGTHPLKRIEVVTISMSGLPIKRQTIGLGRLSVSNDKIIYLADDKTGLLQSIDDGINWDVVFTSTDEWLFVQAIKVTTDHGDNLWINESKDNNYHIRVYSMNKSHSDGNVTWRDNNVITTVDQNVILSDSCSLTYDGNRTIFLTDPRNHSVHLFSASGQYCQLLSLPDFLSVPKIIALDKEHQLLYVGKDETTVRVEVYKLTGGICGWLIYV